MKNEMKKMNDKINYSKYECPYNHLKKDNKHELHEPYKYYNTAKIWCTCGFSGPDFILDPKELGLKPIMNEEKDGRI